MRSRNRQEHPVAHNPATFEQHLTRSHRVIHGFNHAQSPHTQLPVSVNTKNDERQQGCHDEQIEDHVVRVLDHEDIRGIDCMIRIVKIPVIPSDALSTSEIQLPLDHRPADQHQAKQPDTDPFTKHKHQHCNEIHQEEERIDWLIHKGGSDDLRVTNAQTGNIQRKPTQQHQATDQRDPLTRGNPSHGRKCTQTRTLRQLLTPINRCCVKSARSSPRFAVEGVTQCAAFADVQQKLTCIRTAESLLKPCATWLSWHVRFPANVRVSVTTQRWTQSVQQA